MSGDWVSAGAVVIAALLAMVGSFRAIAQTRKLRAEQSSVEQRKLDQTAFDQFTTRYEVDRQLLDDRLTRTRSLLVQTWRYVGTLKQTMREHNVEPPATPEGLAGLPFEGLD
jgi:hypothetical protein